MQTAINSFKDRIDYTVSNTVMKGASFQQQMEDLIATNRFDQY